MAFPFFNRKQKPKDTIEKLPVHLGVIMDGNGRWAKKRGLPRNAGHKFGAEKLRNVTQWCGDLGIKYLTVYAFSTENWNRPSEEVSGLMTLLVEFLERYEPEMEKNGVRLRVIGDLETVPADISETLDLALERSKHREKMQLIIAFNYGGRREITYAAKQIARDVVAKKLQVSEIDENSISSRLYLPDIPDPDIIIRPSGELRLSNFLLWQSAYSELWFSDVLWPDFSKEDMMQALKDYSHRDRRYGGVRK